jgi:hypothetical protein
MATFGQGVNASLGKTNYSNYLEGALQGARGVAAGGQSIGQGIANLGQSIGTAFNDARKRKEEKEKIDGAWEVIKPMAANAEVRRLMGLPDNATEAEVEVAAKKGIKTYGADNFRNIVEGYQGNVAFSAGMDASNRQITESIASTEMNNLPSSMTSAQVGNFNVPSSIVQDAPPQSVEDFLRTGKISTEAPPSSFNDFMDANGITRPQAPEAVQAQETAQAPKSVVIPDNLKGQFGYNSSTGKIIARNSFIADTLKVTQDLQKNLEEQDKLKRLSEENKRKNVKGAPGVFRPDVALTNDEQIEISDRIEELGLQRKEIQLDLANKQMAREKIAELNDPKNINKPLEEMASNIIDKAFVFAQENDLPDLELLEWKMMKDVIKEVKRDATDEEKTAAFVAAYSKIAPINASVYSKIEKIFDKTPAITDLGNGSMIVTVNGQTFLTSKAKETPASVAKMKSQNQYYDLLAASQRMGLNTAMANKDLWPVLNRLHLQYGDKDFSGMRIPLAQLIGGAQSGQTPTDKSTRSDADSIIASQ